MKRPLADVLVARPELAEAETRLEAEDHLEAVFLEAQGGANAYAAERLQEIFEVAERAMALGAAFQPPAIEERKPAAAWFLRLPGLLSRYGGALLLAAVAPLVAEDSMILAAACGIAALLTLVSSRRAEAGGKKVRPKAVSAKFESLVSAADRTLDSMTAPRAITASPETPTRLAEDDILGFLQDAVMASGSDEADELAENAARLVDRAGYRVVREGPEDLFEVMVDPDIQGALLLKPALVHKTVPTKTIFGVLVRGRS